MGLSKSQSIQILLIVDVAFFVLEITVGYAVHSLALVADSFHMLNDVLSLLVGLWAVKVAQSKERTSMYTYGWQRAETVGALVNGVFLVALCLSIVLDAIQRFVEPQEVNNPKLVLIVGCCGLASNIFGLALFHDHGHGGHGHSHGPGDAHSAAEEGHAHASSHDHDAEETHAIGDETGRVADVLPEVQLGNGTKITPVKSSKSRPRDVTFDGPSEVVKSSLRRNKSQHSRSRSRQYSSLDEIYVHPASFRNDIIAAAREEPEEYSDTENEEAVISPPPSTEQTPLLHASSSRSSNHKSKKHGHGFKSTDVHKGHNHSNPKESADAGGHGHSHGDLNMQGVFLHVLGDALGNIGVIASALFIWLTDYSWRFYADPMISLIITVIILCTAIPLCKAASRILLQAVPHGISIDELKDDIEELPGIISAHHIHVWQLSGTKFVASLHVQVSFDFKDEGSARYMELAKQVRKCLHEYGIHSSTIQPEFCLEPRDPEPGEGAQYSSCDEEDGSKKGSLEPAKVVKSKKGSKASSVNENACLLECGDECGSSTQCCDPGPLSSRNSDSGK